MHRRLGVSLTAAILLTTGSASAQTLIGLTADNMLVRIDAAARRASAPVRVTGIEGRLLGIDIRRHGGGADAPALPESVPSPLRCRGAALHLSERLADPVPEPGRRRFRRRHAVSLGLIPADHGTVTVSSAAVRPEPGMLIEITLEPPGGSPTGRPTGPIQFIGRLAPAAGS